VAACSNLVTLLVHDGSAGDRRWMRIRGAAVELGTGKAKTLQLLAEQLSGHGVPVLMAKVAPPQ
jgi:hypothetical protein